MARNEDKDDFGIADDGEVIMPRQQPKPAVPAAEPKPVVRAETPKPPEPVKQADPSPVEEPIYYMPVYKCRECGRELLSQVTERGSERVRLVCQCGRAAILSRPVELV